MFPNLREIGELMVLNLREIGDFVVLNLREDGKILIFTSENIVYYGKESV